MEERYLFRAKRMDNGKWVEGNLVYTKCGYCICKNPFECMNQYSSANGESFGFGGFVPVDSSTICQCTGLKDKIGNLVFENDIMCAHLDDMYPDNVTYVQVVWELNGFYIKQNGCAELSQLEEFDMEHFVVCGNSFDNPDLLEDSNTYDKKEIDRLGECFSRGFASGFTGVKSYISQSIGQYAKQAVDNCYMTHKFENPGMEDGMCAGLRTQNGDGEPCEICKNCKLLYLDEYDRNEG